MVSGKEKPRNWSLDFANYATKTDSMDVIKRKMQDDERKEDTSPGAPLESFVGTYKDVYYGNATLSITGKGKKARLQLVLEPAKEIFTATLDHWEEDTFVFKFKDEFLPRGFAKFEIKEGKVDGFTIDLPNPDFHFSNLSFKK
jgi:hypothetical protein